MRPPPVLERVPEVSGDEPRIRSPFKPKGREIPRFDSNPCLMSGSIIVNLYSSNFPFMSGNEASLQSLKQMIPGVREQSDSS